MICLNMVSMAWTLIVSSPVYGDGTGGLVVAAAGDDDAILIRNDRTDDGTIAQKDVGVTFAAGSVPPNG
jgi:hypothetical protein